MGNGISDLHELVHTCMDWGTVREGDAVQDLIYPEPTEDPFDHL